MGMQELKNQGFDEQGRKQIMQLLWHNGRPKKQATFIWQVINKGIVTGEWLSWRIPNSETGCAMCNCGMETTKHLFWDCEVTWDL